MYKRFFRMKDPNCRTEEIEWIEMSGKEFYRFIKAPQNQERYFIDMGDVVLETTKAEARIYRAEKDHSDYLKEQEGHQIILSIYTLERELGCNGEEAISDETENVEDKAILRIESRALHIALSRLDKESYQLIYSSYLAPEKKTERELARERGLSQVAVHKQKKKILDTLKFLVIKIQKSSQ